MTTTLQLKQALLTHCQTNTAERITTISSALADIEIARNAETKSSAGDKFETGRAMMQMEEAKLQGQLAEALKVRQVLDQINPEVPPARIAAGSLVATNRGNYFLAIGLGKVKLEGRTFFCTSMEAPIGKALHGKETGDSFLFNELEFEIIGVA